MHHGLSVASIFSQPILTVHECYLHLIDLSLTCDKATNLIIRRLLERIWNSFTYTIIEHTGSYYYANYGQFECIDNK